MSDNIYGNNVYSLSKPMWHKKGIVGEYGESAQSVYARMKPVEFVTAPFTTNVGGIDFASGLSGIFRVEGQKVIEIGEFRGRYKITQPIEYAMGFDTYVGKSVETMGFLGSKADKMFITWDLPEIDVYGDKIELYGFIAAGFNGKFGEHLYVTSTRVVCNNTWNAAVQDVVSTNNHGRGVNGSNHAVYSGKHTQNDHLQKFGYWMKYVNDDAEKTVKTMKSLFCKMEETKLSSDNAYGLFAKVFPYPNEFNTFCPPELIDEKQEEYDSKKEFADESRDLVMSLFQGAGVEITPTVWGAFNAITDMQNHHVDSRKNDGTESILLGNRQKIMTTAFNVMKNYIG